MLTHVSSRQLSFDEFQTDLREICGAFEVRPAERQTRLRGGLRLDRRAGLEIAHVAQDSERVTRTRKHLAQDDAENIFLVLQEEGRALMSQNGEARMLSPGDMILIDSARPSDFVFFGAFNRQMSVHLPRQEMVERFHGRVRGGTYLPRRTHSAVAITAVLAQAFSPDAGRSESGHLRAALMSLIGAVLYQQTGSAREIDADVSSMQLLQRALRYIDDRFTDPDLTISAMAQDLGSSARQIQRAFTQVGPTPTQYLIQKRLERARYLLEERAAGRSSALISTIALDSGFNDVSYFNRLFRKLFDCAPGEYRVPGDTFVLS